MADEKKALFWVESFIGGGHFRVMSELARSLQKRGWQVTLLTGNRELAGEFDFGNAEIVFMPGVGVKSLAMADYKTGKNTTCYGMDMKTDLAWQAERMELIKDTYDRVQPDVVVTEMWPYYRLGFDFEMIPFMEYIKSSSTQPYVYSLGRDLMYPDIENCAHPDRHDIVRKYFDYVAIRGDGRFIDINESVARTIGSLPDDLRPRFEYVGYFADPPVKKTVMDDNLREVIVTSGTGITIESVTLFEAAISSRGKSIFKDRTWRVLVPNGCSMELFASLQQMASAAAPDGKIIVERNRHDFNELVVNAALVICHGGNTIIESVTAKVPLIVVAREVSGVSVEQLERTQHFAAKNLITSIPYQQLRDNQNSLAAAINTKDFGAKSHMPIKISGAANLADFICSRMLETKSDKILADKSAQTSPIVDM